MAMTLSMARQLALAALEARASASKYSDFDDAIKVLKEDFCLSEPHEERAPQSQESVNDQLRHLIPIANNAGLYDAADHITMLLEHSEARAVRRAIRRGIDK